jgi:hypothetical protein
MNNDNKDKKFGVNKMVAFAVPVKGTSVMDEKSSRDFIAEKGLHKVNPVMMAKFKKAQATMAKNSKDR